MRVIGLFVCLAGLASAQAILEHAIAAGAGSVSGVAGKGLSDSINKIFEKTRTLVDKSEKQPIEPAVPVQTRRPAPMIAAPVAAVPAVEPVAPLAGVAASMPPVSAAFPPPPGHYAVPDYRNRPVVRVPKYAKGKVAAWELMPETQAVESEPGRPAPTAEDIAKVKPGTSREELLAALGKPSSRVMVPSDGGLLEIYSYLSQDGAAGSVRLTDGAVSSVHPPAGSR